MIEHILWGSFSFLSQIIRKLDLYFDDLYSGFMNFKCISEHHCNIFNKMEIMLWSANHRLVYLATGYVMMAFGFVVQKHISVCSKWTIQFCKKYIANE